LKIDPEPLDGELISTDPTCNDPPFVAGFVRGVGSFSNPKSNNFGEIVDIAFDSSLPTGKKVFNFEAAGLSFVPDSYAYFFTNDQVGCASFEALGSYTKDGVTAPLGRMRLSVWDNKEIQIQVDDTDWNLPSYRIEDANCHEPLTDGNICIRQGTDLETVGNNGNISESASLCSCQGDCDNDKDCAPGLVCFTREGTEGVPGCTGTGEDGHDYCTDRPDADYLAYVGNTDLPLYALPESVFPLGNCEGDCDNDGDCDASLNLKCFTRNGFTNVPSCNGKGARGKDYCIHESHFP